MATEQIVLDFLEDVLNQHNGDHAAKYLTEDATWHGGTVGDVSGRDSVAGLLAMVVTSIPDLRADVKDVIVQDDKVVVRLVVSGTQKGDLLGVAASNKPVRWDAVDVYRLEDGKIAEEWAAEDFTAFLRDTGAYKAPWIA